MTRKTKSRPHNVDETNLWLSEGLHVPSRSMRLMGDINDEMAEQVVAKLAILKWQNDEPITIHLMTGGGDELPGLAIYDAIKHCGLHTTIQVASQAYSMGAIILQAAARRIMLPSAALMIHVGDKAYEGHAENVRREVLFDKSVDVICDRILLERMQKADPAFTLGKLRDMQTLDTYFNAKQAVEAGLADEVFS
jgi:ATP-dependent Clp protease protease subunit